HPPLRASFPHRLSSLLRRPPRPPLFPYTTLFRSCRAGHRARPQSARNRWRMDGGGERFPFCFRSHPTPPAAFVHAGIRSRGTRRSEEHTSELQSRENLVCRLLLEKKKNKHDERDL